MEFSLKSYSTVLIFSLKFFTFGNLYFNVFYSLSFPSMGNGASAAMVGKADALPGRAEAVKVAEEHFVLKGNRQVAPFPEGLEVSACGVCGVCV